MIIQLRTPHQIRTECAQVEKRQRACINVAIAAAILSMLCILCLTGCTGANQGPMTHAAFTAAVTIGEQIALETHPEAAPYLKAAVPVVCSVANGTNVSPQAVVDALEAANVTNRTARLIINSSLSLFNVVISGVSTNQTEIRLYAQDLCNGLTAGLPMDAAMSGRERALARKASLKPLPPHLR